MKNKTTMDEHFNHQEAHAAYLAICDFSCSAKAKRVMLDSLISDWSGHWRVIGITRAALEEFARYDFKRKSGMDLNRSHLMDRIDRNTYLLEIVITDADEWWKYITDHDSTVLTTKSENMTDKWSEVFDFTDLPTEDAFTNSGFNCKYRAKVEKPYLQKLFTAIS